MKYRNRVGADADGACYYTRNGDKLLKTRLFSAANKAVRGFIDAEGQEGEKDDD